MPSATPRARVPKMGYQPGLDGLRAVSVIAVIFYHAGFGWMHGGFFGVEVFFVVSGFLITSLLLEERERAGGVSLAQFWLRRARRLLPALFVMLLAVASWAALFGSAEQTSQLKRDLPWSIFYVANWGQIVGDVPYFQPGDPPVLRHLWSLAVEEQWYVVWPLVFVLLARTGWKPAKIAKVLIGVVAVVVVAMWWVQRGMPAPLEGIFGLFKGSDRVNFNYLSTVTRSGGLLMGAAAAYVWRPWRSAAAYRVPSRPLDLAMGVTIGFLVVAFIAARLTAGYMYPVLLTMVSVLSLVAVLIVVHPSAAGARLVLSWQPLVEVGKRSYGLYLFHWPLFVFAGATRGSVWRFVGASVVAVVVTEVSYRYVETPVRKGAIGRWWAARREREAGGFAPVVGVGFLTIVLVLFYVSVDPFDAAADTTNDDVVFELATPTVASGAVGSTIVPADRAANAQSGDGALDPAAAGAGEVVATAAPTTSSAPLLPRRLAIVGDSQAHALAINTPAGLDSTFSIVDGSLDGCSVYDNGRVFSARESFSNNFAICADWLDEWADAAGQADVALVVLGAWDVFDLSVDDTSVGFASPEFDRLFTARLGEGVDAMAARGARVALLEVACMRPQSVEGAGVPPLPERADDARVAHLNDLLRQVAASRSASTVFVEGPDEWCSDAAIAADLSYRWDGVHVYKPGAKLIFETIAPALLAIPS